MTHKFSDLTKNFSPERRKRVEKKKKALRKEMTLAGLRQAHALTQKTLAETLHVSQSEISKIENRTDVFVSTLSNFIEAMGGELEIRAVFPEGNVRIENFSEFKEN